MRAPAVLTAAAAILAAVLMQRAPAELVSSAEREGLPGAELRTRQLERYLRRAAEDVAPPWRTRHLDAEGKPAFVNRLVLEPSPYLAQHAFNPVDWYPWGREAFSRAAALGRPILLSVGYATCHWCHVMEEESFEDPEIAEILNSRYIAIKVDRETRPDVDALYMTAVQAFTGGRGGWPMTVWLSPDGEPFYGATYIPPRDGMRGRPTGFATMLKALADTWAEQPERVSETTERIRSMLNELHAAAPSPADLPAEPFPALIDALEQRWDATHGGLDRAPKFPSHVPLRALLHQDDTRGHELAAHALEAMAHGGIRDQLAGGFHRYSVDRQWHVPHFEKMLYDNALLSLAYVEAGQRLGDERFTEVGLDTLRAMLRDFSLQGGGLATALDADSLDSHGERVEGAAFTWTPTEVFELLDGPAARLAVSHWGITSEGQLEGRSVLHQAGEPDPASVDTLARARDALLEARQTRPQPLRDDKLLGGQNGLAIRSLARVGMLMGDEVWIDHAEEIADATWSRLWDGSALRRFAVEHRAHGQAQLEDYAFLAAGMMALFEATGEVQHLERVLRLDGLIAERFTDASSGTLYDAPSDGERLIARTRARGDASTPGPSSVHALTLLQLSALTGQASYRDRAEDLLRADAADLASQPLSWGERYIAADWLLRPVREIVLIGDGPAADDLRAVLRERPRPRTVLVDVTPAQAEALAALSPLVRERSALGGAPTVYVCSGGVCQQPVTSPEALREKLEAP